MNKHAENYVAHEQINLGALLREAREKLDLTIASAAMQTQLRTDVIEKMENNLFSEIAAPVYTRGYLEIYARFLKLDNALVDSAYGAGYHSDNTRLKLNPANVASQRRPYRKSNWTSWLGLILVLLLGGTLIYQLLDNQSWLMQQLQGAFASKVSSTDHDSPTTKTDDNIPADKPDIVLQVAQQGQGDKPLSFSAITQDDGADQQNTVSEDSTLTAGTTTLQELPRTAEPDTLPQTITVPEAREKVPSEIVLTPLSDNWMQINAADGKLLYSKVFKQNEKITLESVRAPYKVRIGRPDQVELVINGVKQSILSFRDPHTQRSFTIRGTK